MKNLVLSNKLQTKISNLVHEFRESKKLTQEQLSKLTGIERSRLSVIEKGKFKDINLSTLEMLCEKLQLPFSQLFSVTSASINDENLIEIAKKVEELGPKNFTIKDIINLAHRNLELETECEELKKLVIDLQKNLMKLKESSSIC